jgi:hypothetical protein
MMNDTVMCLSYRSLTDKINQMAYNGKTTKRPDGYAAKVWKHVFNCFCAKNIYKMNELKGEFVKGTLYSAEFNLDEKFSELYFIRWRLEEDYKCNTIGDIEMMNKIIYNTKPAVYQMKLPVIKD